MRGKGQRVSIYVTGDYHGGFQRFTAEKFPQQVWMGRGDYIRVNRNQNAGPSN